MAVAGVDGLGAIEAFALVGVMGVGAQWLAWRLHLPAIVLMLLAGVLIGPVFGVLEPERDLGALVAPMVSVAVAFILFEGGLTLNFQSLSDAAVGVRRLVLLGAPIGWLLSALVIHFVAGLSWESSAVFGGIMIVTGPTVIAPLLRQARLARRPAALLQWEAIVNDPIGALAAVMAFETVVVLRSALGAGQAALDMAMGIAFALLVGFLAGRGIAAAFRRALVPEYMKVPVLFVAVLAVFAVSDRVLHESGLLAVTIMGLVIANAGLASYEELRRFKEHATILLVSGVFILLAAGLDLGRVAALDWRTVAFIVAVVLVVRPLTVLLSLAASPIPWPDRILVAFTGPRGVVLVAVAGLFGERLVSIGVEDGGTIGPLAFVLVTATVVLHGFGLTPLARILGLRAPETPGVLLVGGSRFTEAFGKALSALKVPVLVTDPNLGHLRGAWATGLPIFYGDILSEAADHTVELMGYQTIVAATDNDAYNTLVATDFATEFGRENVFQLTRTKSDSARHTLPATLGGREFADGYTHGDLERMLEDGWTIRQVRLTDALGLKGWREAAPGALVLARVSPSGGLKIGASGLDGARLPPGTHLIALEPARDEGAETPG